MANKTLKTFKFPGLDNTYVITQEAAEFSTTQAYAIGDYAIHEGTLYRFTAAHAAGAWSSSDVVATNVGAELILQSQQIVALQTGKVDKSAQAEKTAAMTQPVGIDSDGTLWTRPGGGGGGTSDFEELTNRPKYNGTVMDGTTDIPEVVTHTAITNAQIDALFA